MAMTYFGAAQRTYHFVEIQRVASNLRRSFHRGVPPGTFRSSVPRGTHQQIGAGYPTRVLHSDLIREPEGK